MNVIKKLLPLLLLVTTASPLFTATEATMCTFTSFDDLLDYQLEKIHARKGATAPLPPTPPAAVADDEEDEARHHKRLLKDLDAHLAKMAQTSIFPKSKRRRAHATTGRSTRKPLPEKDNEPDVEEDKEPEVTKSEQDWVEDDMFSWFCDDGSIHFHAQFGHPNIDIPA